MDDIRHQWHSPRRDQLSDRFAIQDILNVGHGLTLKEVFTVQGMLLAISLAASQVEKEAVQTAPNVLPMKEFLPTWLADPKVQQWKPQKEETWDDDDDDDDHDHDATGYHHSESEDDAAPPAVQSQPIIEHEIMTDDDGKTSHAFCPSSYALLNVHMYAHVLCNPMAVTPLRASKSLQPKCAMAKSERSWHLCGC